MADGLVVFNQSWYGKSIKNVTCFSNFPENPGSFQEFADQLRLQWAAGLATYQHGAWSLQSVTFITNPGPGQFSFEVTPTLGPLAGDVLTDPLPNQAALLVSTIALSTRPNRGRVYFSGMTEAHLAIGIWSSASLGAAEEMVSDWAIEGVGHEEGVSFLRIARRLADGSIDVSNPVSQAVGRTVPANQRRRRREA